MKLIPIFFGVFVFTSLIVLTGPVVEAADPVLPMIPGVGFVTDAAGDCRVSGSAERLTIAIPGGDHALDIDRNEMSAPRVLQEVSGDFTAQVTISGTYPENASTNVSGRRPFQGAGLLLWVDSKTYIRLERAQVKLEKEGEVRHFVYPSWELRLEGKTLRWASTADGLLTGAVTKLRLTRTGNKVSGAVSEDGAVWRELDPLTVKLPDTVQIGVSASHNTTGPSEAVFANFATTPILKEAK